MTITGRNIAVVLLLAGLVGCATRPPRASGPVPASAPGSYFVWIESDPAGGQVVVDGLPQGRTPLRLTLPGTERGFFRADVSVRVRFIAEDAAHLSSSIEEKFSPTDRIPKRILFTPAAAQRVL